MIRKIVDEENQRISDSDSPSINTIDAYIGNLHVSPIARYWNTQTVQYAQAKTSGEKPIRKVYEEEGA